MEEMWQAMRTELRLRSSELKGQMVETIYFGGGTPSVFSGVQIGKLIDDVFSIYNCAADPEVTLEANPDDLKKSYLSSLKTVGVNRLSIGVQSFDPEDLEWMNRSHTADQSHKCLIDAQEVGFDNISIDLIYGLPGQSLVDWQEQMEQSFEYDLAHYSCYALTVEEKTALAHQIKTGASAAPDESMQSHHFNLLMDQMAHRGYEHYEISNYALPGRRSQHNSSYWQGVPYLGIGPSAHSYDGDDRAWNVSNNIKYLEAINRAEVPITRELLSTADRFNEWIMTSLRTVEGCQLEVLSTRYAQYQNQSLVEIAKLVQQGWLEQDANRFFLTRIGKHYADAVSSQMFVVD